MAEKKRSSCISKKLRNPNDFHINFVNIPNSLRSPKKRRDSSPKRFSINSLDDREKNRNNPSETNQQIDWESTSNVIEYFFNVLRKELPPDSLFDTTQTEIQSKIKSSPSSKSEHILNLFKTDKDSITEKINQIIIEEIRNRFSRAYLAVLDKIQSPKKSIKEHKKGISIKELKELIRNRLDSPNEVNNSQCSCSKCSCSCSCCEGEARTKESKYIRKYLLKRLEDRKIIGSKEKNIPSKYTRSEFEKSIQQKLDSINLKLSKLKEHLENKEASTNLLDKTYSIFSHQSKLLNESSENRKNIRKDGLRLSTLSDTQLEDIKTFFYQEAIGKSKKLSSDLWSNFSSSKFASDSGNLKPSIEINNRQQRARENSLKNSREFIHKKHHSKSNRWLRESSSSINIKGRSSRLKDGRKVTQSISIQANNNLSKGHKIPYSILQEDSSDDIINSEETRLEFYSPLLSWMFSGVTLTSSVTSLETDNQLEQMNNPNSQIMEEDKKEFEKETTSDKDLSITIGKGEGNVKKNENSLSKQAKEVDRNSNSKLQHSEIIDTLPKAEISSDESARKIITLHSLSSSCDMSLLKFSGIMNDFDGFVNVIDNAIKKFEISINIDYLTKNIDEYKDSFGFHLVLCLKRHKRLIDKFNALRNEAIRLLIEKKRKRQKELIRDMQNGRNIENQFDIGLLSEQFLSSKQVNSVDSLNLSKIYQKHNIKRLKSISLNITPTPSPSTEDSSKTDQMSIRSKSSSATNLLECIDILDEEINRMWLKLTESTKSILRIIIRNPPIYNIYVNKFNNGEIEYDEQCENFLHNIYQLRDFFIARIKSSFQNRQNMVSYTQSLCKSIERNELQIKQFEFELQKILYEKNDILKLKNNIIRNLEARTSNFERREKEKLKENSYQLEKKEKFITVEPYRRRRDRYRAEIIELRSCYYEIRQENWSIEHNLRQKRLKLIEEISNWITRYDEDMNFRQMKYDDVTEKYKLQIEAQINLEERLKYLLESYSNIVNRKALEREAIGVNLRENDLRQRAASKLQAVWRSYRLRKILHLKAKTADKTRSRKKKY
ncbi:DgyrCDS6893 [Dimorphilus gyrociliatus]|uniref:Dynein regulatory complex protein 10 n=1 Tax=Dimorphilus gyrociliatus TaxID=2664684 RepID=A0A7I8VQ01_9ANNE|nr:DgyrCDS6893 [Dimorphilus gyrociliatus]